MQLRIAKNLRISWIQTQVQKPECSFRNNSIGRMASPLITSPFTGRQAPPAAARCHTLRSARSSFGSRAPPNATKRHKHTIRAGLFDFLPASQPKSTPESARLVEKLIQLSEGTNSGAKASKNLRQEIDGVVRVAVVLEGHHLPHRLTTPPENQAAVTTAGRRVETLSYTQPHQERPVLGTI